MQQCQNCKHGREAHMPKGCSCGCAVFQSPNSPIVFNGITAGEEIMQQMEALRRIRLAQDKLKQ